MQLRLIVNNTSDLDGSAGSSAVFGLDGGVIGSSETADWVLSDRHGSVLPHHLSVHHLDGQFCLNVADGATVYVNGATTPVEGGEMFQIVDGDEVRLGAFTLSVYVNLEEHDKDRAAHQGEVWARRFASVGALVGNSADHHVSSEALFDSQVMRRDSSALHERLNQAVHNDPVEMMESNKLTRSTNEKDPMAVFEREQRTEATTIMTSQIGEILNIEPEEAHYVELPDDLQPGSNYVAMPQTHALSEDIPASSSDFSRSSPQSSLNGAPLNGAVKRPVNNEDVDSYLAMLAQAAKTPARLDPPSSGSHEDMTYDEEWQRVADAGQRDSYLGSLPHDEMMDEATSNGNALIDHVVLRPLCAALGLKIPQMSQPQANRLASEIGAALKAAITGLMEAHRREISDKTPLAETHLHAIEDNPLRLDISVEDAVRDMFLVQSPVHLAAPAAISESLELLRHHRAASEIATEKALAAILQALSPLSLARRFMKYKGHAPRSGDLDAWHWTMYQHYYAEMRSDQQGGLSRMFWEVHRQVYDHEMRHRTTALDS